MEETGVLYVVGEDNQRPMGTVVSVNSHEESGHQEFSLETRYLVGVGGVDSYTILNSRVRGECRCLSL